MGFIASILRWALDRLNYGIVTMLMAVESSFIPFPSEAVVPPAAWKAMSDGSMNIFIVVLVATIGADIGALINYCLARWLGRPIIYHFANSGFGRLCGINKGKVRKAEEYFLKHGAVSTFVGRLIPTIRQLISVPAGLARMNLKPFLLYTTIGAGIWNIVLATIGWLIFHYTGLKTTNDVYQLALRYSHEIGYTICVIVLVLLAFMVWNNVKRRTNKAEDTGQTHPD